MAVARRLVEQLLMAEREKGAVAIRLQGDRHLRFALGRRVPGPAEDEAAIGHHFAVDAADLVIFTVGREAEAKAPADPRIDLRPDRLRPRIRPAEPADYFLRVGPGRVDPFGRRIDATFKGEARSRGGIGVAGLAGACLGVA